MKGVSLSTFDNSWYKPGGSFLKRAGWFLLGQPLVRSYWLPLSWVRVSLLRVFGARIGEGVVIKPAVNIKYPWHLIVGDNCWIGEQCWIDNLTTVRVGHDVCISQGAYLCTGNHDWTDEAFGLIVAPIQLDDGCWIGAKSVLLPGTLLERCAVAGAGSVVSGTVPSSQIYAGNPAKFVKNRVLGTALEETFATTSQDLAS